MYRAVTYALSLGRLRGKARSAEIARDRLMVAVARQRDQDGRGDGTPSYLPQLQEELLAVIRDYLKEK